MEELVVERVSHFHYISNGFFDSSSHYQYTMAQTCRYSAAYRKVCIAHKFMKNILVYDFQICGDSVPPEVQFAMANAWCLAHRPARALELLKGLRYVCSYIYPICTTICGFCVARCVV